MSEEREHQNVPEPGEDSPDVAGVLSPDDPPIAGAVIGEVEAEADAAGSIKSGKLAGKSLSAAIWILALPVLIQQTMQAFVGFVDKVLAGRLPDEIVVSALDGIGIGSYVGWFIGIAMTGLGIGGQAIIARAIGAGNRLESHRALGQAMSVSVIWGTLVGIGLWFIAPFLGQLCQLSDDSLVYCVQYIRTISISMPFCGVMWVGQMCLHGAGETTRPSAIAIGVNVVNILLSWALSGVDLTFGEYVLHNPFSFDLHVIGIAAGTAGSYFFGAVMIMIVLLRGVKDLRLEMHDMRIDSGMLKRIVKVGAPNFAEGISMWSVNLFVLMFIGVIAATNGNSEGLQGAHIIAVQWEAFSFLPGFAMGTAAGALAGQYLGAGNPRMAARAILVCTGITIIIMCGLGLLYIFAGEALTRTISDQPIHLEHVPKLLFIAGLTQLFFAITMVVRQGLRGVGDTRWTFLITTFSSYGVRLPAAWLLGVYFGLGIEGIWIGLCGELAVRAILFSARFYHGGWKRIII